MNLDLNNLDECINILTDDQSLVDELPEEAVDTLIDYLQKEIARKETLLKQLQETNTEE